MRKHRDIPLKKGAVVNVQYTTNTRIKRPLCPKCTRLIAKGPQKDTLKCKACGLELGKVTGQRYRIVDWDENEPR